MTAQNTMPTLRVTGLEIPRPRLYILDETHPDAMKHAATMFDVILPSDPEIKNWQSSAEYVFLKSGTLTAEQIDGATKLRAIAKQGVGIDRIDAEACARRNVKIFNTPGVNAVAVAELVLALTMSVARQIGSIQVRQHAGEAIPKTTCSGLLLTNKTIGLLGMGNIAKAVARIFHGAFGATVIAYDPYLPDDAWVDIPHRRSKTVDGVLRAADVVSIHVPLLPSTRDMISMEQLRIMKPTSILINAARGGIINEEDLMQALESEIIWGAGLDAHMQEPPTKERYSRLWNHPRVVSTPHIGAATAQTQYETAAAAMDFVYEFSKAA
jgi:phosphoglycerate dehydrogenase-like enzyme